MSQEELIMIQEDKDLLLKDLCARLPYGIYANLPNHHLVSHKYIIHDINIQNGWTTGSLDCAGRIQVYSAEVEDIKPYLRPMSSMTKEEKKEYDTFLFDNLEREDVIGYEDKAFGIDVIMRYRSWEVIQWLLEHRFDFNDLIDLGLAIEAPEGMYN